MECEDRLDFQELQDQRKCLVQEDDRGCRVTRGIQDQKDNEIEATGVIGYIKAVSLIDITYLSCFRFHQSLLHVSFS